MEVTAAVLPTWLAGLGPEWAGLSLTMPLKEAVLPLLATRSPLVEQVAAANTVLLPGRRGENTDVGGILEALAEAGVAAPARAVVLGAGATARSALAALAALGCPQVVLVARSEPVAARAAAARLGLGLQEAPWGPGPLAGADLVVSTVPAGAADGLAPAVASVPALLDVVYDPWPTALAAACRGVVVGGAAMLLHQAAGQVALMTGRPAPLAAMRRVLKHLG